MIGCKRVAGVLSTVLNTSLRHSMQLFWILSIDSSTFVSACLILSHRHAYRIWICGAGQASIPRGTTEESGHRARGILLLQREKEETHGDCQCKFVYCFGVDCFAWLFGEDCASLVGVCDIIYIEFPPGRVYYYCSVMEHWPYLLLKYDCPIYRPVPNFVPVANSNESSLWFIVRQQYYCTSLTLSLLAVYSHSIHGARALHHGGQHHVAALPHGQDWHIRYDWLLVTVEYKCS